MPGRPRLYATPFSLIFPLYVRKAERKGRTREEVEAIVTWLIRPEPMMAADQK